jgi:ornithine carbamoyltransferase
MQFGDVYCRRLQVHEVNIYQDLIKAWQLDFQLVVFTPSSVRMYVKMHCLPTHRTKNANTGSMLLHENQVVNT